GKRLREREIEAFNSGGIEACKRNRDLTSREAEVLQLVAEGFSNQQTADHLGISIKTIEKHRQQVMNKLNIHETAGLTRYAISRGLVETSRPETFEPPPNSRS